MIQEYTTTDRQLHWLSQAIAKTNRAFVAEKKDDSHTNLYFDPLGQRIMGRWFDTKNDLMILSLNLPELQFEWLDQQLKPIAAFHAYGLPMRELEEAIGKISATCGLDTKKMFDPLHFSIPDYHIHVIEQGDITPAGLQSWSYYRSVANQACQTFLGHLQSNTEVRIWPHHFDTGAFAQVTSEFGIGFGLAMNDEMVGEPYFYVAGYNTKTPFSYHDTGTLRAGKWITGTGWKGAVLPMGETPYRQAEEANPMVSTFFQEVFKWYTNQL